MTCRRRMPPAHQRRIAPLLALLLISGTAFLAWGCDAKGTGHISGRLAAFETPAGQAHILRKDGRHKIGMDQLSVDLLQVTDPGTPDAWPVLQTVAPAADGTFDFSAVPAGRYAVRVNQPEFASNAYFVDSTDFQLGSGDSVSLVLPLVTEIALPLTAGLPDFTASGAEGSPVQADPAGGTVYVAASRGFLVLDAQNGTVDLLKSSSLFGISPGGLAGRTTVYLPQSNAVLVVLADRAIRIDLGVFTDPHQSEVLDLDDPNDKSLAAPYVSIGFFAGEHALRIQSATRAIVSSDESTVYVTPAVFNEGPLPGDTAVLDASSLSIRRTIGAIDGYHPDTDRLIQETPHGCTLVEASTLRDVGPCYCGQGLPVPGTDHMWIVSAGEDAMHNTVPFIREVDRDCQEIRFDPVRDVMGVDFHPPMGLAAFDQSGELFSIGGEAFQKQQDGTWRRVPVQVQPGDAFLSRVECHPLRLVDPRNRYRLDWGCAGAPLALYSLDQRNIPVAIWVQDGYLALDAAQGRAMVLHQDRVTLVHYADPEAYDRTDIDLSGVDPGPEYTTCSDQEPCPSADELCVADSSTSLSGLCYPNTRRPFRVYCGGMTSVPCDSGQTCAPADPANPFSLGRCEDGSVPCDDLSACGPDCSDGSACGPGTQCEGGRCVNHPCVRDADCDPAEVCGQVPGWGRGCVTPGTSPEGALCSDPAECASGACLQIRQLGSFGNLEAPAEVGGLSICARPCFGHGDCGPDEQCTELIYTQLVTAMDPPVQEYFTAERRCVANDLSLCTQDCPDSGLCGVVNGTNEVGCTYASCFGCRDKIPCADSSDCPDVLMCLAVAQGTGTCAPGCHTRADCEPGLLCHSGGSCDGPFDCNNCGADEICFDHRVCVPGEACASASDCASGACVSGVCGAGSCTRNGDCPSGQECVVQGQDPGGAGTCLAAVPDLGCGCAGPNAPDAVCWMHDTSHNCIIRKACSRYQCDGFITGCDSGDSSSLGGNGQCDCPMCTWDAADCGNQDYTCPAAGGYACNTPETFCYCTDSSCMP